MNNDSENLLAFIGALALCSLIIGITYFSVKGWPSRKENCENAGGKYIELKKWNLNAGYVQITDDCII